MTDETKQLFDAPWTILSDTDSLTFEIRNKVGESICDNILMFDDAKRLARLPELYDALMDAANRLCGEPKIRGEYACKSCVVKDSCQVRKWYELLEKVRDGK